MRVLPDRPVLEVPDQPAEVRPVRLDRPELKVNKVIPVSPAPPVLLAQLDTPVLKALRVPSGRKALKEPAVQLD